MAYIPKDAKWYLADVVVEFRIHGEEDSVVHTNRLLVRADSPEEAFDRALALGRDQNSDYINPQGKAVKAIFRGLRDLNVIHGELEHGTELIYAESIMTEAELEQWVSKKQDLGVFKPGEITEW